MQCKCGGTMKERESVNKKLSLRLTYAVCDPCGRMYFESLFQDGRIIERGVAARDKMNGLEQEEIK